MPRPVSPCLFVLCLAAVVAAATGSAMARAAEAEAPSVYLCPGNVYQDSPCKGGRPVDVSPAATLPAETRIHVPSIGSDASGPYVGGIPNGREQGFSPSMSAPVPQWPRRPHGPHGHPWAHPYTQPFGQPYSSPYSSPYAHPYGTGLPAGPGLGRPPPLRPIEPPPSRPAAPPPRMPAPNRFFYEGR